MSLKHDTTKRKGGKAMKYIPTLLAALLVVASLRYYPSMPRRVVMHLVNLLQRKTGVILADEGRNGRGEYSESSGRENETVILADEGRGNGDDMHGEPSPAKARNVVSV
jgi:hypothetical protein